MFLQLTEPQAESMPQVTAVGIDLGTTHSVVAIAQNQQPRVLPNAAGENLIPSVVYYPEENGVLVGSAAQTHLIQKSSYGIRSVKRLMCVSAHLAPEHQALLAAPSTEGLPRLRLGTWLKTPVEVSADILKALKVQAETALNHPVNAAVITVPAYFDEGARQATKDAATLAGLEVLRLINEPTAAALAYGLDKGIEGIYAIYDLGGGTFDVSLLKLHRGVFQVLATGGHTHLGGDDVDHLVLTHWQVLPTVEALQLARQAKHHLSHQLHGTWHLPDQPEPLALDRFTLDHLMAPMLEQTITICRNVLIDADLTPQDIQGVVLVGGATRMPALRQRVADFFGQSPLIDVNPDEVVALGAALQAEALTQGGGQNLLLDITPLSLGVETMGGLVEKIIPRNTPIPTRISQVFTTHEDGQTQMKIHVLQGEREQTTHCRSLGEFILAEIPVLPAGQARVEITYALDADGLLTVSAQEQTTGVHQSISVKPSYGLSEAEREQILRDSYMEGQQDLEVRLLIEAKLKGEELIRTVERALAQDADLLEKDMVNRLQKRMSELKIACERPYREAILKATEQLSEATQGFAEKRLARALQKI